MKKTALLKQLLYSGEILVMPGAYDCLSAIMVQNTGFKAAQMSGYGFAACLLGQPDCGLLTFTEVLNHTRNIVRAVDIPHHGGRGYRLRERGQRHPHRAGIRGSGLAPASTWRIRFGPSAAAICPAKRSSPPRRLCAKIRAAAWARKDKDFIINARTDARQKYGPQEVVRRARMYWKAGADLIFLEAPQSKDELKYYAAQLVSP